MMENFSTKEKILESAIILFSDRGYDIVSMRDIAGMVGIKAASIYHHYKSKQDIFKKILDFFADTQKKSIPVLDELLPLVETEPVHDILRKLDFRYPKSIKQKMDRIIQIIIRRTGLDKESENYIKKFFFEPIADLWKPVIRLAVDLKKIEPLDIEAIICLASNFLYGEAQIRRTALKIGTGQLQKAREMLLSLLKPVKKTK